MKTAAFIVALLLLAACGGAQQHPQDKGYSVSGREPSFRFDVDARLLREWGGPTSAKFNQVLEEELERLKICRGGYSLRQGSVRDGLFSVSGRCKS